VDSTTADTQQRTLQLVAKTKQQEAARLHEQLNAVLHNLSLDSRLSSGAMFVKHGRAGRPHPRFLRVVNDRMEWSDTTPLNAGHIKLSEVIDVVTGRETAVLKRTGEGASC
jgi:hypothetical protein